jgi:UDP-N-acetylglucosamine:LPS N-acetylglucosamine transferase
MTVKRKKILAIASPGGHWIQLNKICNPLEDRFDVIYVTPGAQYASAVKKSRKIFTITDASADSKHKLIPLAFQLLWIFIKERPTAIISTGAAPGAIAFLMARFLPIKTIWVDSIANVSQLSRSARLVQKHADKVITQWESLSDGKSITYQGSIL